MIISLYHTLSVYSVGPFSIIMQSYNVIMTMPSIVNVFLITFPITSCGMPYWCSIYISQRLQHMESSTSRYTYTVELLTSCKVQRSNSSYKSHYVMQTTSALQLQQKLKISCNAQNDRNSSYKMKLITDRTDKIFVNT